MAEFETNPELTRVLNLSNSFLGGISRTQLQFVETQHLRAEIPLIYMGRYKESYQLVMQQRAKLEDELQSASRAELAAQHNVEKAHNALVASGGSIGHINSPSSSSSSSNSVSNKTSDLSARSPSSSDKKSGTKSNTSEGAAGGSTGVASSPGTPSTTNPSQGEMKAQTAERVLNQAKLDLAAAEDNFEQKRASAEEMNASLRAESSRLEALERAQLMVNYTL